MIIRVLWFTCLGNIFLSSATVTTLSGLFSRVSSTIRIVLRVGKGHGLSEFNASVTSFPPVDLQQPLISCFQGIFT